MKYYCNPLNLPYKYQFVKHNNPMQAGGKQNIYREAADPSLILFKDIYYLFPSMTAGFFTSDDLCDWTFHEFLSNMPIYDYAPDVRAVGDYLYFCASKRDESCSYFRTKDPLTEPFEEIPGTFAFWDPNLFLDDDGRLYFYWGCSNMTPIYGVELDPDTMKPLTEPLEMFDSDNKTRGYERVGYDHVSPKTREEIEAAAQAMIAQMMQAPEEMRRASGFANEEAVRRTAYAVMGDDPYIEGAWMTKHNGRYYLQYAIPGTEYNVYGDGVFVADKPLGPYTLAENNPYSYKPGGFMTGAGHGSTLEDKRGNFWHTSTMQISHNDSMERRVGLWRAGFDGDGELYCDQRYGDWPVAMDAPAFSKPQWMLLSYGKAVRASSGQGMENVTDENARTWWKAETSQPGQWVEVDLGKVMDVHAIQINFADDQIQAAQPEGAKPFITYDERYIDQRCHRTRWVLEGSIDGENYFVIEDKSKAETDLPHDFIICGASASHTATGPSAASESVASESAASEFAVSRSAAGQSVASESAISRSAAREFSAGEPSVAAPNLRYIRLTVVELPYDVCPCVSGIRIFGNGDGPLPEKTAGVTLKRVGSMNMEVSWQPDNAVGHNILWGHTPEKLYHSYMVFGKSSQNIGALIKDAPVYVRVDAFNETGITEGDVQAL